MTDQIKSTDQVVPALGDRKLVRLIRWYEKCSDQLVGESVLENLTLSELQTLFSEPPDNPMYDCYPVFAPQASYLQKSVDQKIDLESYDCYLECDAV